MSRELTSLALVPLAPTSALSHSLGARRFFLAFHRTRHLRCSLRDHLNRLPTSRRGLRPSPSPPHRPSCSTPRTAGRPSPPARHYAAIRLTTSTRSRTTPLLATVQTRRNVWSLSGGRRVDQAPLEPHCPDTMRRRRAQQATKITAAPMGGRLTRTRMRIPWTVTSRAGMETTVRRPCLHPSHGRFLHRSITFD